MHRDCAVCTYSGAHVILWVVHDVWFNCSDAGICHKTEFAHLSLNIGKVRVLRKTISHSPDKNSLPKIHYQKFKSEALAEGGAHKVYTLYHKFTSPTLKSSSVLQHFKCSDAHVGQFLTRAHLALFPGPAQLSHVGRAWERGCHTLCQWIWTCMQTHTHEHSMNHIPWNKKGRPRGYTKSPTVQDANTTHMRAHVHKGIHTQLTL